MPDDILKFASRLQSGPTTRQRYAYIIGKFKRWAGSRSILDRDTALEFLATARAARTRNQWLVAINAYRVDHKLKRLPARALRTKRHQFNTTRIREAFDALLPLCHSERDRALLALLRYGGLRISEAVHLKAGDITFPEGQLQVSITVSKTNPRDILAWRATRHLRDYIDRSPAGSDRWLFPSRKGGHLSRRTFESWLARESAAVGYRISPHDLRRLCATEMAKKFGLQVLMDYFGWESAQTAQVYIDKARGSSAEAIRGELGIGNKSTLFTTEKCWRCGSANQPAAVHCCSCGELLDKDAIPQRERIEKMDLGELEGLLVQILKKRGILSPDP